MKRMAGLEGMAVQPGMEVYHIADLRSLWLSVEVFEQQVAQIDVGSVAEIELTYFPGEIFRGTVRFIEPEFSETTRTLQAEDRGGQCRWATQIGDVRHRAVLSHGSTSGAGGTDTGGVAYRAAKCRDRRFGRGELCPARGSDRA